VIVVDNYGASTRVVVAIYKNDTYTADDLLERVTIGITKDGEDGGSLKASVDRSNFTETQWNQYGEIGRVEYWSNTNNSGFKDGDMFMIVGKATDTGKGH
jgi:hypothetical protein